MHDENSIKLSQPNYRPDIDGLRAVAVLAVVGYHAFPGLIKGGFIGVDIFFIISGFLISIIIFENLARDTFSFSQFYSRRIRRIFPTLIVVLIASVIFGWFSLFADEYKQLGKHIAGGASYISNFILWNESGYFDNASETKPLLHLWSLGIEEQFYIVWPFLLWTAWKYKFHWFAITSILCALSFFLNIKGVRTDGVATFYSPQTRVWELLLGSLLAYINLYKNPVKSKLNNRNSVIYGERPNSKGLGLRNALSFFGFLLIVSGLAFITKEKNFPGASALLPTAGTICIIAAGSNAWFNRRVLSGNILVWFGLISFPLYLWHWPLLSFARIVESGVPIRSVRFGIVLLSILMAWLTYRWIEKPIRYSDFGKKSTGLLVMLMVGVAYIGYVINSNEGFEFRSSISKYVKNNKNELIRTPSIDDACLTYIQNKKPSFKYCRYTSAGGKTTVAVIGDSHAHVAYSGIAELLKKQGINTVLLANSGCVPFLGAEYGENKTDRIACKRSIDSIIEKIISKKDIKKVFIFSRGMVYISGKSYGDAEVGALHGSIINAKLFADSLQKTIDRLNKAGKNTYYVAENPELPILPNACIARPFRTTKKICEIELSKVKLRQEKYLEIINQLKNVVIIDTLQGFCNSGHCKAFREGQLLYADYDHLSVSGSRFQANSILSKYLV